jgi:hypothetical protein
VAELAASVRNHWANGGASSERYPQIEKIPVLFPVSRQFRSRDGFDRDCVRHHSFSGISEDRSLQPKSGQLRGLSDFRLVCGRPANGAVAFFAPRVSGRQNSVSPRSEVLGCSITRHASVSEARPLFASKIAIATIAVHLAVCAVTIDADADDIGRVVSFPDR